MTMTDHSHASAGHHEAPEVIHHRQRLGIWIFIAGDVVSMCALLFTYLYLRGTNTGGHWMSIEGVPALGRSMESIQAFLEEGGSMITNVEAPLSAGLAWAMRDLRLLVLLRCGGVRTSYVSRAISGHCAPELPRLFS